MTYTLVQSKTAQFNGGGGTLAFDDDPIATHLLVAVMAHRSAPGDPGDPSGWTRFPDDVSPGTSRGGAGWWRAAPGGAVSFDAGTGIIIERRVTIMEFDLQAPTLEDFVSLTLEANAATYTIGDVTVAGEAVLVGVVLGDRTVPQVVDFGDAPGYTHVDEGQVATNLAPTVLTEWRAATAGTHDFEPTQDGDSTTWGGFLAAFAGTPEPPTPGVAVEWDGVFVPERIRDWTIQRGASAELTGGTNPGSATVTLINTPDDRYNPENTGGDLYGLLHDGPRVWIGVNEDGTVAFDAGKDVHGLFAGRITDISPLPEGGATVAPFVEVVCADPFEWASRQKVSLPDSRTRSQADLRAEVLDALGWTTRTVPAEPATLPLSAADGLALNVLDRLNASNGTRHFAKPEDSADAWFRYVAVRRTSGLDGSSSAALDAGSEHVTGTTGWRRSADGIVNQQRATVEPIAFPGRVLVWQPDTLPFTVTGELVIWTEFGDYVDAPEADIESTGDALTWDVEPFGDTAKVTLTSAGTSSVFDMRVTGYLVQRGSAESVVIDDAASQAEPRGVRAGPDLSGDYLGTLTSARGFASHIVYRFAGPLYRPTVTVVNWFPEMFELDLFDRISVTVAELSVTDRIFEIVGLTLHGEMAAADEAGNPTAVLHTATYVLQESREQTDSGWFILDDSLLDGDDILAY